MDQPTDKIAFDYEGVIKSLENQIEMVEREWDRIDARGGDTFALSEKLQELQQHLFDTKERFAKFQALSNRQCVAVGSA